MGWALRRLGGLRRVLLGVALLSSAILLLKTLSGGAEEGPSGLHSHGPSPTAAAPPPSPKAVGCGPACPLGELSFNVSGRLGEEAGPGACLGGLQLFAAAKLAKGLNLVVLDESTRAVEDIAYLDMAKSDAAFLAYMRALRGQRVVLLVSWGDVADKLSSDGREVVRKLGSLKVGDFRPGSAFALVGQVGLRGGAATEAVAALGDKEAEAVARLDGCLKIPMGPLEPSVALGKPPTPPEPRPFAPLISRRESVTYGVELAHCGMKEACAEGSFAFSAYSGKHKDDEPKMCIGKRFVISRDINNSGRGLNIVVLNATASEVLRVGHFDTYSEDSSTLEIFLEQLIEGEMIAVISFDEASNRLSNMAKTMLYELGSGQIQNLKFRASWFFIGQKGINGFTPFEELNFASGSEWAKPVDLRTCVPARLDGRKVRPDPPVRPHNAAKRNFCKKYDGYEEFCDDARVDDVLLPAPLYNKSLEGHAIFAVPILVAAGLSHNSLRLCLETLLRQPGLAVDKVLVTFDENYPEGGVLAGLFGFRTSAVPAAAAYAAQLSASIALLWGTFPEAKLGIVVEEELLLTADFLAYLAPLTIPLLRDPSLLAASGWNENGFIGSSGLPDAVYRVDASSGAFPGLAFMLKKDAWDTLDKGNTSNCCGRRVWEGGWAVPGGGAVLVPDVSRVLRRRSDGLGLIRPPLDALFQRERVYANAADLRRPGGSGGGVGSAKPEELAEPAYSTQLNYSIKCGGFEAGRALTPSHISACTGGGEERVLPPDSLKLPKGANARQLFVVYVKQAGAGDFDLLRRLAACFGLFHSPGERPKGLYRHSIRFSYYGRPMMLIGSLSPYYAQKPFSVTPFAR